MLKKHLIIVAVVTILSIVFVGYMYSQNYISFQGGLYIIQPSKIPASVEKSIENEVSEHANVQPQNNDTNLVSKVQIITPSDESTKQVEEPRLFDDVMKATETFSPIISPFIAFYLFKKKKKIDKDVKDDDE
jgi:preprotein translocase subunit SecF